ncbi:hypothetical protein DP939_16295 [Spongiactinospora rosea]|uniref:ATP-binding cassette subfamily B protein n=1 Tax=Spongiactinospora rosea TaxID=2248750 RepID=A0A366LYX7_9ACTN|nr:ATP-binding cassette domain-containing protein [Spongiactinospora rosea]RBQ18780.1 hypothetical protein DP939_16295 [Spongiactinospora rosea]
MTVNGATDATGEQDPPAHGLRDLLRAVAFATRLNWRSGRLLTIVTVGAQLLAAVLLAAGVLAAAQWFEILLAALQGRVPVGEAVRTGLPFLTILAVRAIAAQGGQLAAARLGGRVGVAAQAQVLAAAARTRLIAFQDPRLFDRLHRANLGAAQADTLAQQAAGIISAAMSIAAAAGAVVTLSPLMALLIPASLAPQIITEVINIRYRYRATAALVPDQRRADYLHGLQVMPASAKELRAYQATGWLADRWRPLATHLADAQWRIGLRVQLRDMAARAVSTVLFFAVVAAGIAFMGPTAGAATAAIYALLHLRGQTAALITMSSTLQASGMFLADLAALAADRSTAEPQGGAAPEPLRTLRLRAAGFRYPGAGADALTGIDLDLHAGQVVALVGENGSGKTTLAMLVAALYRPTCGTITWNDADTATLDPHQVRARIAWAFQDFTRYAFTLSDNITLGPDGDPARLRQATAAGRLQTMLQTLPHGLATLLNRQYGGQVDLSGGQWQRLAIARAFYRRPDLLILDEPTAALDPAAEQHLFRTLARHHSGTVLLITHRIHSVTFADHIYVLHQGRIAEHGTHEQLIAANGHYTRMYDTGAGD